MKGEGDKEPKDRTVMASSRKWVVIVAALLIIVAAGAAGLRVLRGTDRGNLAGRPVPTPDFDTEPSAGGSAARPDDLLITIPPEKLENARLKIEAAAMQSVASTVGGGLRTTGAIEANSYKVTPIMPIAGGVVREVHPVLGDKVERGQKLATIFSAELADAQTAYLSMQAEIEKHHQKYQRAEKLVEIGAASREDFEEVSAEYKIEQAKLTAARQKLLLLGMSAKQVDGLNDSAQMSALISVEAPASGTILSRAVNAGEVVTMGKELFRIADLSTMWAIGQVYEKDFGVARVGVLARITAPAYPGRTFSGRVSYIDPRVDAQTRTAQIRIEVSNPNDILKLGMFVDVNIGAAADTTGRRSAVGVPRGAVQMIGAKQVVYVVTDKVGVFAQREVIAAPESGGTTQIYEGLGAGDRVVTEGSFLLRAESLKLNPAQLTAALSSPAVRRGTVEQIGARPSQSPQTDHGRTQSVTVTLGDKGYQPGSFKLQKGIPARVTFVRTVEATCGGEVVLPEYNIKRELPLNQPVVIEFTPAKTGEFKFACGMDMLRGKIIVQ